MTAKEIAREVFPGVSDADLEYILWERTAFPFLQGEELRAQLVEFRTAAERYPGATLCDFCNNLALRESLCATCLLAFEATPLLTA